jgi:predicted nucleic acid-binding protein
MGLLLDTTVLIDALRGRAAAERVRALASSQAPPFVCAINVEEVWRGARPAEEEAISGLLGGLGMAPLGEREGRLAGTWRRDFAARGITLGQSDCLIAAAAVGIGAVLATGDPDGFPMPGVDVEHWPVGT